MEKEFESRSGYSYVEIAALSVDIVEVKLSDDSQQEPRTYYLLLNERVPIERDDKVVAYYVPATQKITKKGYGKIDRKLIVLRFSADATIEHGERLQDIEAIMKDNIREEVLTENVWQQYHQSLRNRKLGGMAVAAGALLAGTVAAIAVIRHKKR